MSDLIRRAREALVDVTPGPWVMETVRTSCGTCHRIGPFPRPAYASKPEGWACVYDDYPPGVGSPDLLANSRFIAVARDLVPALADRLEAQEALLREADEALIGTLSGLVAAISLLERGGKKAAASDKMFDQMLKDYNASADKARATLAKLRQHLEDSHAK